ncbi:hypothetical protein NDU88_002246 [Pleurodeles waltl]|uniref:Uncharacterized protein n=1 Tax=Pleurodeles waltl TaxID=8319 RepID=A0AAV7W2G0_PLEWA|nr:hypothetical protein NDU88_002246 [Pleurodeles waltl]
MCVNPEVEGYAGRRWEDKKTLEKTSVGREGDERKENDHVVDERTKNYSVGDEDGEVQTKERRKERNTTEEASDPEHSAKFEIKEDNANTGCHVPGGTWLLEDCETVPLGASELEASVPTWINP